MRTVATVAATFNPGAVKAVPVIGKATVYAGSRNVAYATVREHLVKVTAKATTNATQLGSKPTRSSSTITTSCQFRSFHKAKFTWR